MEKTDEDHSDLESNAADFAEGSKPMLAEMWQEVACTASSSLEWTLMTTYTDAVHQVVGNAYLDDDVVERFFLEALTEMAEDVWPSVLTAADRIADEKRNELLHTEHS